MWHKQSYSQASVLSYGNKSFEVTGNTGRGYYCYYYTEQLISFKTAQVQYVLRSACEGNITLINLIALFLLSC